jgi:hypothetical protein
MLEDAQVHWEATTKLILNYQTQEGIAACKETIGADEKKSTIPPKEKG